MLAISENLLRLNSPPSNNRANKSNRPARSTMFSSVRSRSHLVRPPSLPARFYSFSLVIYFIVKQSVLARTDAGLVELSDSFIATLEAELTDAPKAEGITPAARQSMLEHQYPAITFGRTNHQRRFACNFLRFAERRSARSRSSRIRSSLRRWCSHASLHSLCHPIVPFFSRQTWRRSLLRANLFRCRKFLPSRDSRLASSGKRAPRKYSHRSRLLISSPLSSLCGCYFLARCEYFRGAALSG